MFNFTKRELIKFIFVGIIDMFKSVSGEMKRDWKKAESGTKLMVVLGFLAFFLIHVLLVTFIPTAEEAKVAKIKECRMLLNK